MAAIRRIVIIGGGQAGGRLAQLLAAEADRFDVTLVSREPHPPYERPPLSKGILLGSAAFESCLLWPTSDPAWTRVERLSGVSAESIDRASKTVRLSTGEALSYDVLVLATGSAARRLIVPGSHLENLFHLRNIEDCISIERSFAEGKRLVVVGGGFIGLEIAACARTRGLHVTVVEASDRVLGRLVPQEVAHLLAKRHASEGVLFALRTTVERFLGNGDGSLRAVELSSGQIIPCDVAIIGIGAKAETELSFAAGLHGDGGAGMRVDASLRAADPAIFACGDVATFWHKLFDQHLRLEAWHNAEEHARVVACVLNGEAAVADAVPWFWSDQYELSLQIAGLPHLGSSVITRTLDDGAVILFHLDPTGRIMGVTGLGKAASIGRDLRVARTLIAGRAHPSRAGLRDPGTRLKSMLRESESATAG